MKMTSPLKGKGKDKSKTKANGKPDAKAKASAKEKSKPAEKGPVKPPTQRMVPSGQKAKPSTNLEIIAFGLSLRDIRMGTGMTLDQLSEMAELTPNYIGTIENGYRDPSLSTLQSLASGLGIPLGELFGPAPELSQGAMEMARLFNEAPEGVQRGVLILLRGMVKRGRPLFPVLPLPPRAPLDSA